MTVTRDQLAGGIVVAAGIVAAAKVIGDAPELSDEDMVQAKKAALGLGSFVVVAYLACKRFKWSFCKDIGAG